MIGANPNVPGGDLNTVALHEASSAGCSSICQLLIKKGASKRELDSFGRTPADVAINALTKNIIEETEVDITYTEELETTLLLNSSTVPERFVIFYGLLDKDQSAWLKQKQSNTLKSLNFTTTMKLHEDVTHVVVNLNEDTASCQAELNYYNSILMGKWIVDFEWLKVSIETDLFASEEDYVAKGNHDCRTGIPRFALFHTLFNFR